jgi:hypothetical protein
VDDRIVVGPVVVEKGEVEVEVEVEVEDLVEVLVEVGMMAL